MAQTKQAKKTHTQKRSRTLRRSSRKTMPNTWTHVRCLPSSTFKHKYCFSYCLWLTLIVIVVNSPAKDAFIVVFTSFFSAAYLLDGWLALLLCCRRPADPRLMFFRWPYECQVYGQHAAIKTSAW